MKRSTTGFLVGFIAGVSCGVAFVVLLFTFGCIPRATVVPPQMPDNQAAYDSLANRAVMRDLGALMFMADKLRLRYDLGEFSEFVCSMRGGCPHVFGRVGAGITTGGERRVATYLRNDGWLERLYYFTDIPDALDWVGCVYDRRDGTVWQYGFDLEWW